MRRFGVVAALALLLLLPSTATALTVDATPESQSHAHGSLSSWTESWSGSSPYSVTFSYGDGTIHARGLVTYTAATDSHAYWPCSTTTFTANLAVSDQLHDVPIRDYVTTQEQGGNPC